MVPKPKLTPEEITEQASVYVLVATNEESVIGQAESRGSSPLSLLNLVRGLRKEADDIEARVFE